MESGPASGLFGQIAVSRGYVTPAVLEEALAEQAARRARGESLEVGQVLLRRRAISTEQYVEVLAAQEVRRLGIGRYEVRREVGRGGMAVVYEAYDPEMKRRVALKVVREASADLEVVQRLHREAVIAGRLRHPNIVATYDVGTSGQVHYIAMEFLTGKTLTELLAMKALERRAALEVLRTAASAVGHAHAQGVIHRDLKPGNIMVEPEGRVVVVDFGLARLGGGGTRLTQTGAVMGTPAYMAPEQVLGKADTAGPRTDVYALGAILYEALTGRPPFDSPSNTDVFYRVVHEDVARPSSLGSVDRDLERICLKALDKEPARRYAGASEFAADLARYLAGEPVLAKPSGAWDHVRRRVRRNPIAYGLGAAAALAVAALVVGGIVGTSRLAQAGRREQLAAHALGLSRAFDELREGTREDFAWAEVQRFGEGDATDEQLEARAKAVAGRVDAVRARRAGIALPDAWEAWFLLELGRTEAGERLLARACERAGALDPPDPFPFLFRARWSLVRYFLEIEPPGVVSSDEEVRVLSAAETPSMAARRAAAKQDLDLAARYPYWAEIPAAQDYFVLLGALDAFAARDYGRAAEGLDRIRRAWDLRVEADALLGLVRCVQGDVAGAVEAWSRVLELRPRWPWMHHQIGLAWYTLAAGADDPAPLLDRALPELEAAIDLRPDYGRAYISRGLVYHERGEYDRAIEDYTRAHELLPGRADALANRGLVYHERGEWERAIEDFTAALERDPDSAEVSYNRANSEQMLGLREKFGRGDPTEWFRRAEVDYRRAIELDAGNWAAYHNLGLMLVEWDRREEAVSALEEAVRLAPNRPEVREHLDEVRSGSSDY